MSPGDGFAYIHSRFVLHMDGCEARPIGFDHADITTLSTHLAEAVMDAEPESPQSPFLVN